MSQRSYGRSQSTVKMTAQTSTYGKMMENGYVIYGCPLSGEAATHCLRQQLG